MTQRDIERLMALADWCADRQVHWAAQEGDYAQGRVNAFCEAEYEIRQSIAELGQEVGAVVPEPFGYFHPVDGFSHAGNSTNFRMLLDMHRAGRPNWRDLLLLYTSPAHTSEARDAVSVDVREMKTSLGRDYYVCVQVGDRYLTPNVYREKWKADFDAAEWTALFNGTARPDILSFMPEDAAMRQEGGTP